MEEPVKRVARLALLTALGTAILLLTNLVPAGRLGLLAVASFPVCAALMMYGPGWAFGVFAVTALLGFLLFPGTTAVGYVAFFGYYPIAKSLFERCRSLWLCRGLKLVLYVCVFIVYWLAARAIFGDAVQTLPWYVLCPAGLAVFAVFDWCYSQLIRMYIEKIARYVK